MTKHHFFIFYFYNFILEILFNSYQKNLIVIFASKETNLIDVYDKLFKKFYARNFTLNLVKSSFSIIKYYEYFYNGLLEV